MGVLGQEQQLCTLEPPWRTNEGATRGRGKAAELEPGRPARGLGRPSLTTNRPPHWTGGPIWRFWVCSLYPKSVAPAGGPFDSCEPCIPRSDWSMCFSLDHGVSCRFISAHFSALHIFPRLFGFGIILDMNVCKKCKLSRFSDQIDALKWSVASVNTSRTDAEHASPTSFPHCFSPHVQLACAIFLAWTFFIKNILSPSCSLRFEYRLYRYVLLNEANKTRSN